MKPLLQTPITREQQSVGDWIPAKDQATVAGVQDFWQRQQARIKAAQAVREEARAKTVSLPRRRPVREESA